MWQRFSRRKGLSSVRTAIQYRSMDEPLRNKLWNIFVMFMWDKMMESKRFDKVKVALEYLWHEFFAEPIDTMPNKYWEILALIRKRFFEWEWHGVCDFLEFTIKVVDLFGINKEDLIQYYQGVLESELAGYKFVNEEIVEIIDKNEIGTIEQAFDHTKKSKLRVVNDHLDSALTLLTDREKPNHRKSTDESILAVEALCRKITGKPKATLGEALDIIEKEGKIDLHPALKQAYSKIYGYSSDADGIRHAMSEQSNCDFADAKYMLVSCSAFINYLVEKSAKAGIKF